MTGVAADASSKSSSVSATPASCAIASRCSTALVDPAVAATRARHCGTHGRQDVARQRGFSRNASSASSPQRRAASSLAGSVAAMSLRPSGERPSAISTIDIVFAVNWPPQAPAPGQALRSTSSSRRSSMLPAPCAPTASKTCWIVIERPSQTSVRDAAAVQRDARNIEARQRHRRGRNRLVAAAQHDHRVETMAIDRELDRIGDDFAADQRRAHAGRSHRDAVGHRDRVELDRRATGRADTFAPPRRDRAG